MAFFDVAGWETFGGDGIEEVFPEFADILAIGGVELWLDVDGGLFGVGGEEGPTVAPAHVEGAFSAVEIATDGGLLGIVVGVETVLPGAAEAFEFKARDKGVWCIGVVLTDETTAG